LQFLSMVHQCHSPHPKPTAQMKSTHLSVIESVANN
jgi:hypothetical protein